MSKSFHYIFIDESGDPGQPYKVDEKGNRIFTGSSLFYILTALCLDSKKLFLLENKFLENKNKYKFKNEIKSETIPLTLYQDLLKIINELEIKIYYRLIDKLKYRGKFSVDGVKKLHNVFDEYNLVKLTKFAIIKENLTNVEIVIDRADRRLLDGKFDNFNNYLFKKINTKNIKRVEYVNAMQMSDLVSGAIRDHFTKRNIDLKKIIKRKFLSKIY